MGLLLFVALGLLIGSSARAVMPRRHRMGILGTSLLGMMGSLLGGFLGSLITQLEPTQVHVAGLLGCVLGSVLLLFLVVRMGDHATI